ncbi:MAG: response regulator transcription factor [Taibaiella sp.]|nr:response regulator transcription factor [Taibaiella sp.]
MMKPKILYVEDEPFLARIVKETLELKNYEVLHIKDGGGVLGALHSYTADICVMDVMLPNTDGFTLGEKIRKLYPGLPLIFLTAKTNTTDVLQGFSSGGTDYLKKPFSMEELMARIDNQLRIAGKLHTVPPPQTGIKLGGFVFYPVLYELHSGEVVIKLSHRETQVLNILCDNCNRPIDRRTILNLVWGDDSFFNSRNLDVYIRKLREHLRSEDSVEIITLKGIGYHFIVRR